MRRDLRAARERDPAARSTVELVLCYPGVHAVWGHRVSGWLWRHGRTLPGPALLGADPAAHRGGHPPGRASSVPGLFIDHATGVVIGETAEVGADVTIYHGVTLGGTSLDRGKRHPTVGDRVTIGAGAKVLGPITIGHDSRIGANAVVVKPVPPDSVVVGVPGQVIMRKQRPRGAPRPPTSTTPCCPTWSASACARCSTGSMNSRPGWTAQPDGVGPRLASPRPAARTRPARRSGTSRTSRSDRRVQRGSTGRVFTVTAAGVSEGQEPSRVPGWLWRADLQFLACRSRPLRLVCEKILVR